MTSGAYAEEPTPLPVQLVAYNRDMARAHTNDPVTGLCPVCQMNRCQDFRSVRERLGRAGEELVNGTRDRWADLLNRTSGAAESEQS